MNKKSLTCINCPMGCSLLVTQADDGTLTVEGNSCPAGRVYAEAEMTNPVRTVCSTALVRGGEWPLVPCKTNRPVPKDKIFAVMEAVNRLVLTPPIALGSVLIADVCGTGADLVATQSVESARRPA